MKTNKEKIKVPVLIPLTLAIIAMLGGSIFSIVWLQRKNITKEVKTSLAGTRSFFYERIEEDALLLNGLIDFLKEDKQLKNAWLKKDRDELLEYAKPLFENIRSKYRVTHFYFHDLDGTCFLRVHKPSRYGDFIKRFTMDNASRQGKPSYGIELGPLGTFTLRTVHPWLIDGQLVGYMELGEEIEHITPKIKKVINSEIFIAIDKSYLNRAGWEEGMKMLGRAGHWDLLSNFAIIDYTLKEIPEKIARNMDLVHTTHEDLLLEMKIDGLNYYAGFVPLIDAGGRDVGDLIVIKDITEKRAALRLLSSILTFICIVVGIVLFVLFYLYIKRIELKLTAAYSDLKAEIKHRKEAEKELRKANDEMDARVKERTAELAKTNELLNKDIAKRKQVEQELNTTNLDLASTVRKLEQLNREINHLVSITSHDLREPSRKISMFAQLLKNSLKDKLNDDEKENLEFVLDGANRMTQIVAGIRTYSELANSEFSLENTDLKEIVNHLEKADLSAILKETGGTIEVPRFMPKVKASPVLMRHLLKNLIANGIKYRNNQVKPNIEIRAKSTGEGKIRIEVQDNGIGIKEEFHEDIFKMFKCLHLQQEYRGIGIGLALCKKIMEKHDGEIGVESKLGEGATFWFTLSPAEELAAVESIEAG